MGWRRWGRGLGERRGGGEGLGAAGASSSLPSAQPLSHSSGVMRPPEAALVAASGGGCSATPPCRCAAVSLQKMLILHWFRHFSLQTKNKRKN